MNTNSKKALIFIFLFSTGSRGGVENPLGRLIIDTEKFFSPTEWRDYLYDQQDKLLGIGYLRDAILSNDVEKARALIKKGVDVNRFDRHGETPLIYAVGSSSIPYSLSLMKLLIAAGADVNKTNKEGVTPLLAAASRYYFTDEIKLLIDAGARINQESVKKVKPFIKEGDTPLIVAVRENIFDNVKPLIDAGAEINKANKKGQTPLMVVRSNRLRELLIDKGTDVKRVDDLGFTALINAAKSGKAETIQLLIEQGADVNEKSTLNSVTPLERAIEGRNIEVIKLLLAHGAQIKDVDRKVLTSTMFLSGVPMIMLLMEQGVSLPSIDEVKKRLHNSKRNIRMATKRYLARLKQILENQNVNKKIYHDIVDHLKEINA